jgi:hypothetical protein
MRAIALILASIATGFAAENTQALFKELATTGTPGARRDELVAELSACTFSEVGTQAVQAICRSQGFYIYNPMTGKPWLEDRCPESERIRYAAGAIWHAVTERAEAGSLSEPLARLSLEDRPEGERMIYLNALFYRHYDQRAKAALERLAHDKAQPPEIGVKAAEILVQKADANAYMHALIEACDRIKDALPRSERFRFATERLAGKISAESKKMILNYGFAQLTHIDDGESGRGYFLAMHLGSIIGIKPIRDGQGAFAPDQRLQQYQGEHGLKDSFFQDTVNNAQEWWRKNKKDYVQQG